MERVFFQIKKERKNEINKMLYARLMAKRSGILKTNGSSGNILS